MHTHMARLGRLVCAAALLATVACTNSSGTSEDAGGGSSSTSSSGGVDGGQLDAAVRRDASVSDAAGVDAAQGPCSPALTLMANRTGVLPFDLATFAAAGGTGQYRFSLTGDVSGGIVNELTGAYLSGGRLGDGGRATDEVTVTDLGCIGSATATITVVPPMRVAPTRVELPPATTFRFEVLDGLGPFTFELVQTSAGGTIATDGTYTAPGGTASGRDVVRVRDTGGGQTVDATIDVVPGASLTPGQGTLFVPVGATFRPSIVGGSGHFDGTITGSAVTFQDNVVTAVAAGSASVSLTDRFTGLMTVLQVVAVGAQQAPTPRAGDQSTLAWAVGPGDVTGDGRPDALLGVPELDFNGLNTGALYLYKGGVAGLEPTPLKVLAPQTKLDNFGRVAVVADFNGDGVKDLAVGAPNADVGALDNGAVYVHLGSLAVDGGTREVPWDDTPTLILSGRVGSDLFGTSLATCDFNGDGRLDLAVGAPAGEDPNQGTITSRGAVSIYLGYPDGFLQQADVTVFGSLPDVAGVWAPSANLQIGNALAAGDMDLDGLCDLAVQTNAWARGAGRTNDGLVFIYKGVAANAMNPGGVQPLPSRALASNADANPSAQFGRYLAMADLNGDRAMDLVASEYQHEKVAGQDNNHGGVRVFMGGGTLPTMPPAALAASDTAEWLWEGVNNGDNAGWWVTAGDADGDDRADVVSGNLLGEVPDGGPANAGSVTIFAGLPAVPPATTPTRQFQGLANGDRFGQNVAVLGDVTGDMRPDFLVFAGRADAYGYDVGVPYFVSGDATAAYVPLELPGGPSGAQLGRDSDVVGDVNGDGFVDLVVGAPNTDSPTLTNNVGVAHLYLGTATGFEATPALTLSGFPGHSSGDQLGFAVSRAGDFDGDGFPDFAVVARSEDRPNTFDVATYVQDGSCAGTRNDAGAVYIFRGKMNGLPDNRPSFVFFGPQASQVIETLAGGFDWNNDGRDDLIVGSAAWDDTVAMPNLSNVGGVAVITGRPADGTGKIIVVCDATFTFLGLAANNATGRSVAAAGDINGDGCDDVVVGANGEDFGKTDQGSARVFFGAGGAGCPASPTAVVLIPDLAGLQAGWSVGGNSDVDGDAIPDVAVGGIGARGTAWVVPGAYIRTLTPVAPAATDAAAARPLVDAARSGVFSLTGTATGDRFGSGVALVPRMGGGNRAALAVGVPRGGVGGTALTGGVQLFRFVSTGNVGLDAIPVASMGGETARVDETARLEGRVGETLRAGLAGTRPVVAVNAYEASAVGRDEGTAYVMVLTAP
jgi:hypothetical protein